MKVNVVLPQNCQVIHLFLHPQVRVIAGEGVMLYRFNPLMSAVFVSSLVAAMFPCVNWDAVSASECVGKPDQPVNQVGHWYYYVDHVHHRRCWFFEPSKATVSPAASADRVPAQQSWFSRLTTVPAQPQQSSVQRSSISAYSSEPPQNTVLDDSIVVATVRSDVVLRAGPGADFSAIGHVPGGTELKTTDCMGGWCRVQFNGIAGFVGADLGNDAAIRSSSARRAENRKLTSPINREQSQTKPPPATNGVANAERHDQLQGNGEKNEKPSPQLADTERQALFDDFLRWYRDRSVFGRPHQPD